MRNDEIYDLKNCSHDEIQQIEKIEKLENRLRQIIQKGVDESDDDPLKSFYGDLDLSPPDGYYQKLLAEHQRRQKLRRRKTTQTVAAVIILAVFAGSLTVLWLTNDTVTSKKNTKITKYIDKDATSVIMRDSKIIYPPSAEEREKQEEQEDQDESFSEIIVYNWQDVVKSTKTFKKLRTPTYIPEGYEFKTLELYKKGSVFKAKYTYSRSNETFTIEQNGEDVAINGIDEKEKQKVMENLMY